MDQETYLLGVPLSAILSLLLNIVLGRLGVVKESSDAKTKALLKNIPLFLVAGGIILGALSGFISGTNPLTNAIAGGSTALMMVGWKSGAKNILEGWRQFREIP